MKIRVPVHDRPPERFKLFQDPGGFSGFFRVVGVYRAPKYGEYYWADEALRAVGPCTSKSVILKRVK